MSLSDRLVSGLRTIFLIEERTKQTQDALASLKARTEERLTEHERRLVRLETIVEITRPDGSVLRIAQGEGGTSLPG
jgi:ferritin-like metal-binding protein YciE